MEFIVTKKCFLCYKPKYLESIENLIKERIKRKRRGELLFPEDFEDIGSSGAVRIALYRLEKKKFVKRVARGIYVRPKISKHIGEVLPTAEEVARGIAKRDRIRLVPTGPYALHALGLSEQIPMRLVFLTDGTPRIIKVGKRTIKLKKATPKNLMAKGRISGLVIQALKEIGKDNLSKSEESRINKLLRKENPEFLSHDIELAPSWIKKIMKRAMIDFFNLPDKEKETIFNALADKTGMPPYAIEKDWWVTQTLRIIFKMGIGDHLVFKGGTSLSKGWKLIERFSEDIDLAVDRSFLGYDGDLSKKQRSNLRRDAKSYVTETLYSELIAAFAADGLDVAKFSIEDTDVSDRDPNVIEIYYPEIIKSPGYIEPKVQVEIGCRSLMEPHENVPICSLVDEYYADKDFAEDSFEVPVVRPERTLLEKLFLLHEEFQRPKEKVRVTRLSRHLYDLYQLSKTEYAKAAINNKALYETIVNHRYCFNRVGGVNYNLHDPKTVLPFPPKELVEAWNEDYTTMQEQMIYGTSPTYDNMIEAIQTLLEDLKNVDWEMTLEFDPPAN